MRVWSRVQGLELRVKGLGLGLGYGVKHSPPFGAFRV